MERIFFDFQARVPKLELEIIEFQKSIKSSSKTRTQNSKIEFQSEFQIFFFKKFQNLLIKNNDKNHENYLLPWNFILLFKNLSNNFF